jgi:hypothetical protein
VRPNIGPAHAGGVLHHGKNEKIMATFIINLVLDMPFCQDARFGTINK